MTFHSKTGLILSIFLLFNSVSLFAQKSEFSFSGNISRDVKRIAEMNYDKPALVIPDNLQNKKSVVLAGVLSAVLPGSGEFYSEEYTKSAIFLGIEATAIILGLIYDKKGNDQTDLFQGFANQHWSAERYAKWTVVHARSINPNVSTALLDVFDTNGKVIWNKLNSLETAIGQSTNYYSHRLAYYGDQQYYEMIGKYPQFNPGWEDFGDENTPFQYGDKLTDKFYYYSGERAKANDFYNIASKAVLVIFTNHVISMFDAIWSAASFNKNLQINVSLQKEQIGFKVDYSTMLNLKYNF